MLQLRFVNNNFIYFVFIYLYGNKHMLKIKNINYYF